MTARNWPPRSWTLRNAMAPPTEHPLKRALKRARSVPPVLAAASKRASYMFINLMHRDFFRSAARTAAGLVLVLGFGAASAGAQTGLVAAYSFNEGTGTTVTDLSGNGNTGTVSATTWSTAGKYGGALSFNGTSAVVTIPDSASLRLTTAMTLEAWVRPTTVTSWGRAGIYKGNGDHYLMATSSNASRPAAGGIFGGSGTNAFGTAGPVVNTWN